MKFIITSLIAFMLGAVVSKIHSMTHQVRTATFKYQIEVSEELVQGFKIEEERLKHLVEFLGQVVEPHVQLLTQQ